jgi:alpha-amylase
LKITRRKLLVYNLIFIFAVTPFILFTFDSGTIEDNIQKKQIQKEEFSIFPIISIPKTNTEIGEKVMLQSYFWEVPDTGEWWTLIQEEMDLLASSGFDSLWLPPMVKTKTGNVARCGYEPYDYYDLGEFNQKGSVETRYGSRQELEDLINIAHQNGISAIADIIINHNNGGEMEENPYVDIYGFNPYPGEDLGNSTPTNFMNVASGLFPRNYSHFHPCEFAEEDNAKFGYYPDLCHENPEVQEELITWGNWLKDEIGFDGWRFDMALGIIPEMFMYWMQNISNTWGVGEYWTGNEMTIGPQVDYLDNTNNTINSFDFLLTYELHDMSVKDGNYEMSNLENAGLLGLRPDQAVTFVVNHDTWRQDDVIVLEEDRLLAYSYILTHEGYPMVYWEDYFNLQSHHELSALIKIHNDYAKGNVTVLYSDSDLYVMQREGDPGLILVMNDNPTEAKSIEISSKWTDSTLYDLMGRMDNVTTDSSGVTTLTCPPNGYAIFSTVDPIYTLDTNLTENNTVQVINGTELTIDGRFDKIWPAPQKIDPMGDSGEHIQDLSHLYLSTDEEYLYIGFSFGKYQWKGGNMDYGIAFDTQSGGNREDPGEHELITWAGYNEPDVLCYFKTYSNISNRIIQQGYYYTVDEENIWQDPINLVKDEDFASNPAFNFVELKLPLQLLGLEEGGTFRMKVFSSPEGSVGATDSIPQDAQVNFEGDEQTWISLSSDTEFVIEPIEIEKSTKKISSYPTLFLIGIISVVSYMISRKINK